MPISGGEALGYFTAAGYGLLPITSAHAAGLDALPPLHADPFDRMLVVQSLLEPLRLVTGDRRLLDYCDTVILV